MIKPNQATIEAYNKEADAYISKTPNIYQSYHKSMLNWISTALNELEGNLVFEIGSATPRDADYIRSSGFFVQTSDASQEFVYYLRKKGDNAILFNALTDPMPNSYHLIFANAVVPHFTYEDTLAFLSKAWDSLPSKGRLAFNVKIGVGESWINEKLKHKRFTHYWTPVDIKNLLAKYNFKLIFFESNVIGDLPNHHWINIVVEKRP